MWTTALVDGRHLKADVSSLKLEGGIENRVRKLLPAMIAGYQPYSTVTDYAAIDKDQKAMEDELERESDDGFSNARAIYKQGGYSKSYAVITLDRSPDTGLLKDRIFKGVDSRGRPVTGRSYETPQILYFCNLQLRYESDDGLEGVYPDCNVGALVRVGEETTDRCFAKSGTLQTVISGQEQTFGYSYDMFTENLNARTIQGFSRLVETDMINCVRCPYPDVGYAVDYYGTPSYSNLWIEAAFDSNVTPYTRGNADFSDYGHVGRAESIRIGTVTMNIFMYVLRELEDAVGDCEAGSIEGAKNWDEGVALYTGSLEMSNGQPKGILLHQMADDHCAVFKTCGSKGNTDNELSKVNRDIFALFEQGQKHILSFDCKATKETKNKIANLMYIPLIQGTINAAYRIEFLDGDEKVKAQGAVFAAAVLPRIHVVNENAAKIIYENMRVGANSTSYSEVEVAFRSVYSDLNINCGDVGGMWNKVDGKYYKGASLCGVTKTMTKTNITGYIIGGVSGSIVFGLIGFFFYRRGRNQIEY